MRLPPFTKSLRFRFSGMTSGVVFGLGGVMLAVIYLVLLSQIRNLTERALLVTRVNGVLELTETEWRTIESVVREAILNKVAWTVVIVLAVLFFASLVVGWLVAGRALRPLSRITQVAQDIEATDLSRRIALAGPDDELTRMAATFDSMLDRLDRAFSSQKDRLARTSHDLRTPLAIIRSNLDVTMSDPSTTVDDWRQTGAIALRASERMSTMIDDLLAAARMEAGSPTLVNVDLATLARTVVGDFDAKASGEGVQLVLSARPALVLGDRLALSRAMENVIDNAISVAAGKVVVGTGRVEDWGYLSVTDDGPGVDPAVVRGERPAEGRFGLAIVREIARLHGGSVDARKLKSGGSVVAVWLPLGAGTGSDRPPMSALDSL